MLQDRNRPGRHIVDGPPRGRPIPPLADVSGSSGPHGGGQGGRRLGDLGDCSLHLLLHLSSLFFWSVQKGPLSPLVRHTNRGGARRVAACCTPRPSVSGPRGGG